MAFQERGNSPGVYVVEVDVPGAIVGVGTSTAAFVGPARDGDIGEPTFLTSWKQFVDRFGVGGDPYLPGQPPVYLPYAVRGFFENGGRGCYVVRVSTGSRPRLVLKDAGGVDTVIVASTNEGDRDNGVVVSVASASITSTRPATGSATVAAAVPLGADTITVDDTAAFQAGDPVLITEAGVSVPAVITRVDSAATTVTVATPLATALTTAATVRIGDVALGANRLRVVNDDGQAAGIQPGTVLALTPAGGDTENVVVASIDVRTGVVQLATGLATAYPTDSAAPAVTVASVEFDLTIGGTTYPKLSLDSRHSRYLPSVVNPAGFSVRPADPPSPSRPPLNHPSDPVAPDNTLSGGTVDDPATLTEQHFLDGIEALVPVDDVNVLCVPDATGLGVQQKMIAHCETMQDRFTILDPVRNASIEEVTLQRNGRPTAKPAEPGLASKRGFGALYYPWIVVAGPPGADPLAVPPSGHVAGLYARVDAERGVFKAPANANLVGVRALQRVVSDQEQGPLNDIGVNVIRSFPGRGILVWGARTIAPPAETQWKHVNVRRLLLFLEESIQEATQFAVFEPNNLALWGQLKRQVSEFLTRAWADGALFGATAADAFRVRIDEELNPAALRQLGQLNIEVTLYPTTTAEFVVFTIIQRPGGPETQE